jgi:hypothetical protein
MKRLLLLGILSQCLLAGIALAQVGEPILIGIGSDAKWSPNEKSVSYVRRDTLFLKGLDAKTAVMSVYTGPIAKYEWLDDSTFAIQTRTLTEISGGNLKVDRILRVPIHGLPEEIVKDSLNIWAEKGKELNLRRYPDGSVGYDIEQNGDRSFSAINASQQILGSTKDSVKLFVGTVPRDWGKVWLYYGTTKRGRQVTFSENFYNLPLLAPSNDRLFCYASRGDLVVFDTTGHELGNLGVVSMASWDHSGKAVAYCVTQESEFDLEKSDIFISNFDGSNKLQLTSTPDRIEVDPEFSTSGHYVLYREYRRASILVMKLK